MRNRQINRSQRGTALVVAMLIIFMLTIMGMSAMRGSSLEHQMATNAVQAAVSFQAAESSTDLALNDTTKLNEVRQETSKSKNYVTDLKLGIDGMVSEVTLRYVGYGPALGASTSVRGGSSFRALRFEAQGTASIDAVRSNATVLQGAYRRAP
ncbi:PilX N-terminal domain-containing pilus assembly protein [bacterium]|nr:PilX N-terminal domain-containing pilus assembly protein [bacterium]